MRDLDLNQLNHLVAHSRVEFALSVLWKASTHCHASACLFTNSTINHLETSPVPGPLSLSAECTESSG